MKAATVDFGTLFHPVTAFVVYRKENKGRQEHNIYVESYDINEHGCPVNAHPLSVSESTALAKAFDSTNELQRSFLKPEGLLPKNVIYINPDHNGYAVWHTPQQTAGLLFKKDLGISNGKANVPALLWKASRDTLCIYALKNGSGLNEQTSLYHAPFFNVYEEGKVCMGTVAINISPDCLLEEFMTAWESYFFNSYFSHLFRGHIPVRGNIVQLWQSLVNTRKKYPVNTLITNGLTIKDLIR
jgi:PRTRC genetic system protein B